MTKTLCKPIVRDPKSEAIRVIETRTRETIEGILKKAGIKRNSQDCRDYVSAKRLIFKGHWITKKIYDQQIQWILSYLGL